jgi:hypothetical protein
MSYDLAIQRLHELKRVVANDCMRTTTGAYAPGEVPESSETGEEENEVEIAGYIQVVYAIVHVDMAGRIRYMTYNPPDLLDAEGKPVSKLRAPIGSGTTMLRGSEEEEGGSETSSLVIDLEWEHNPHISSDLRNIGNQVWDSLVAQADAGSWRL